MKIRLAAFVALLALSACESTEQLAWRSCRSFRSQAANEQCRLNEIARINGEWDAVGASMASRPVQTTCAAYGGIVTCR